MAHCSPVEAAYLAGFFDGEGCVTLTRRHRVNRAHPYYTIGASISQTDLSMLQWVKERCAGQVYHKRAPTDNAAEAWIWMLQNKADLRRFLELIHPYAIRKRPQIELGLAFLDLAPVRLVARHTGLEEDYGVRDDFKERLTLLNKRGAA